MKLTNLNTRLSWVFRELCMALISEGKSVKEVAGKLELHVSTIKRYIKEAKLNYWGHNNPRNQDTPRRWAKIYNLSECEKVKELNSKGLGVTKISKQMKISVYHVRQILKRKGDL